jgi:hypothetical protein
MKRKTIEEITAEETFDKKVVLENREKRLKIGDIRPIGSIDREYMLCLWERAKGLSGKMIRFPWNPFHVSNFCIGLNYLLLSFYPFGSGPNYIFNSATMCQFQISNFENENEVDVFTPRVKKQIRISVTYIVFDKFVIRTVKGGNLEFFSRIENKFGLHNQFMIMAQPAIWCTGFSWEVERLLWIGKMKNDQDCPIARLPKEIVKYIIDIVGCIGSCVSQCE